MGNELIFVKLKLYYMVDVRMFQFRPRLWTILALLSGSTLVMLAVIFIRVGHIELHIHMGGKGYESRITNYKSDRLNVLFICVDDMRGDISPFNQREDPWTQKVHTPNLERLASRSLVFSNAHTQYPYCNPSRTATLTGRRPDSTQVRSL